MSANKLAMMQRLSTRGGNNKRGADPRKPYGEGNVPPAELRQMEKKRKRKKRREETRKYEEGRGWDDDQFGGGSPHYS